VLLDEPSWYLDSERRHRGSVLLFRFIKSLVLSVIS